jgi:hydrogenase maturation protease
VRDALPHAHRRAALRIIGVGNRWRGDDAAGLVVVDRLRGEPLDGVDVFEHEGEPSGLLDEWQGAEAVWLVDAVSSGAPRGTVHRHDAGRRELPADLFRASTHTFGVADAVELARALGRLPASLVVYGIEGRDFEAGARLGPEIEAAASEVVSAIADELKNRHAAARSRRPKA